VSYLIFSESGDKELSRRDSSVGIVTRLWTGRILDSTRKKVKYFSFLHRVQTGSLASEHLGLFPHG
jgi:hypothetical protein